MSEPIAPQGIWFLYTEIAANPKTKWLVIDSSQSSVEQNVGLILEKTKTDS